MRGLVISLLAAGFFPVAAAAGCSSIPATSVKVVSGGYELFLYAGEHPDLLEPYETFIPFDGAYASPDSDYHACFRGGSVTPDLLGPDPTTTRNYPQWHGPSMFLSKFLAPGAPA